MAQTGAWARSDNRASHKGVGTWHRIDASSSNRSLTPPDFALAIGIKSDCPMSRTVARRRVGRTTAI